ncbi:MAG: signal peptidase I [Nitrospirae bacterium]|nr:signal peptidase I [Nitrospirota bacterium]
MKQSKLWEYTKAILVALFLALVIRTFVVQAFKIPSGSMLQTLLIGDHILVNKFIYGVKMPFIDKRILILTRPKRGDIVVFKYPEDPKKDFIKRVAAVEGDIIEARRKVIYINDKPIDEPYVNKVPTPQAETIEVRDTFGPYLVPTGKIFVMGDNRDHSYDSRFWGYVDEKDLRGKAFIIYWSWDGIKNLPRFGRIGNLIN